MVWNSKLETLYIYYLYSYSYNITIEIRMIIFSNFYLYIIKKYFKDNYLL